MMAGSTKTVTQSEAKAKKAATSSIGAPSQRNQSSRKGKRAWRKNIDVDEVEEGLETIRTEERVIGSAVHQKSNDDLFVVDIKGDDKVRRNLPRYSKGATTAAKILAQRSAVPSVLSRTTSTTVKRKRLTHEEKDKLLRIGKRARKGPFNAVMDPTEVGAGSALLDVSEAVKQSGQYDVWEEQPAEKEEEVVDPLAKSPVKAPSLPHPRQHIQLPAVIAPHEGTSYNPTVGAHMELIRTAVEKEERREKEAAELAKTKEVILQARKLAEEESTEGVPAGMAVQEVVDEEQREAPADALPVKKIPERKTKNERRKAERLREERRVLAEKLANKRLLDSVYRAKSLRKKVSQTVAARERKLEEERRKALEDKMKKGLTGQRLGKHVVPEGNVEVQLTEDLSESLRTLKVEGNLFKDRFLSMQQRALIEPRAPVLPKRKAKLKEYEKHAWKRFEREDPRL